MTLIGCAVLGGGGCGGAGAVAGGGGAAPSSAEGTDDETPLMWDLSPGASPTSSPVMAGRDSAGQLRGTLPELKLSDLADNSGSA